MVPAIFCAVTGSATCAGTRPAMPAKQGPEDSFHLCFLPEDRDYGPDVCGRRILDQPGQEDDSGVKAGRIMI